MKRNGLFLFVILMVFAILLSSCGDNAKNPTEDGTTKAPSSTAAITVPLLTIDKATDEVLSQNTSFDEFVEFAESDYPKILIKTNVELKKFKYIELGYNEGNEQAGYFEKNVLYSQDKLSSEKPFVVTWKEVGLIANRGISFEDENNSKKFFYITQSGEDGTLKLTEFYSSSSAATSQNAISAYNAVLQNKTDFIDVHTQKSFKLNQYTISSDENLKLKFKNCAIIDLDKDGVSEIVLWEVLQNKENPDDYDEYVGFEVLRYMDGKVFGYNLPYRGFNSLKTDGTFSFSSGAGDSGFGDIQFTKDKYEIEKTTYSESNNETGEVLISFYVNKEKSNEENFQSALFDQEKKQNVVWHEYTEGEGVLSYSNQQTAKTYKEVYSDFLKDYIGKEGSEHMSFSLRELTGDDIPELIFINANVDGVDSYLRVYTFNNGINLLGEYAEGKVGIYGICVSDKADYPGLFNRELGGGVEHHGYISIKDNKLVYDELWKTDRTEDTPEEIHISTDENIIAESKRLFADDISEYSVEYHSITEDEINRMFK